MTDPRDAHRQWRDLLNATLQEELATLDLATRSRLQQARNRALARKVASIPIRTSSWWGFPLGAALAGVVALAMLRVTIRDVRDATPEARLSDVEWTFQLATDETEFAISEDLEFYEWLAAREFSG